jgi:hypothetical protein
MFAVAQGFAVGQLELLMGVTELGEKLAIMPVGRFGALNVTADLKLSTPLTVMEVVTLEPGKINAADGLNGP